MAGHEPEKTNELLQAIGRAIDKKLNSSDAVEAVKNGKIPVLKTNKPSTKTAAVVTNKPIDTNKKKLGPNEAKVSSKSKLKTNDEKSNVVKNKKPVADEKIKEKEKVRIKPNKEKIESSKRPTKTDIVTKTIVAESKSLNTPKTVLQDNKLNVKVNDDEIIQITNEDSTNNEIEAKPVISNEILEIQTENNLTLEVNGIEKTMPENNNDIIIESKPITIDLTEVVKDTSVIEEKKSASSKMVNSHSAELVDVIDQEAELRRKEKSEKRRRERKKSSEKKSEYIKNETEAFMEKIEEPSSAVLLDIDKPITMKKKKSEDSIAQKNLISNKANAQIVQEPPMNIRPRTSLRPPSVRPASARPGAPRRRDRNIEIVLQPEETVRMAGINVKMDSFNTDLDDEGENLVIIEDPLIEQNILISSMPTNENITIEGSQGHLVQQILETQKEFSKIEDTSTKNSENRTDIVSFVFIY